MQLPPLGLETTPQLHARIKFLLTRSPVQLMRLIPYVVVGVSEATLHWTMRLPLPFWSVIGVEAVVAETFSTVQSVAFSNHTPYCNPRAAPPFLTVTPLTPLAPPIRMPRWLGPPVMTCPSKSSTTLEAVIVMLQPVAAAARLDLR